MGALEIEVEPGESVCICQDAQQPLTFESFTGSCTGDMPGYINCMTVTPNVIERTAHLSDGVVIMESATDYYDAKPVLMDGSNHQQMRNDENTLRRLNELWGGDHGTFFETDTKQ